MAETIFGQIVVGPPGSGKSTYCKFICENLKQLGRNAHIINLDPANDCLVYKPAVDLSELVTVQMVMEKAKLGPNGAIIHCMELLEQNYGWLYDKIVLLMRSEFNRAEALRKELSDSNEIKSKSKNTPYLILDCPGQTELYTHQPVMRKIIRRLVSRNEHFDLRLVCMNLCDAYHASDLGKYIGVVTNSLSTMLNLELPHVNVLSKVDKIESYGKTRFNLDFYCEVMDLNHLLDTELDNPFFDRYRKLSKAIAGVIEQYGLVQFVPLNISQAEDIYRVVQMADKANGYHTDDLDLSVLQLCPSLIEMISGRRAEEQNQAMI